MLTQTFFRVIEIGSYVVEKMVNKTGFTVGISLDNFGCSSAWCHTWYFVYTNKQTYPLSAISLLKHWRKYLVKMHLGAFLSMQATFYTTEIASMIFILQHNC